MTEIEKKIEQSLKRHPEQWKFTFIGDPSILRAIHKATGFEVTTLSNWNLEQGLNGKTFASYFDGKNKMELSPEIGDLIRGIFNEREFDRRETEYIAADKARKDKARKALSAFTKMQSP